MNKCNFHIGVELSCEGKCAFWARGDGELSVIRISQLIDIDIEFFVGQGSVVRPGPRTMWRGMGISFFSQTIKPVVPRSGVRPPLDTQNISTTYKNHKKSKMLLGTTWVPARIRKSTLNLIKKAPKRVFAGLLNLNVAYRHTIKPLVCMVTSQKKMDRIWRTTIHTEQELEEMAKSHNMTNEELKKTSFRPREHGVCAYPQDPPRQGIYRRRVVCNGQRTRHESRRNETTYRAGQAASFWVRLKKRPVNGQLPILPE